MVVIITTWHSCMNVELILPATGSENGEEKNKNIPQPIAFSLDGLTHRQDILILASSGIQYILNKTLLLTCYIDPVGAWHTAVKCTYLTPCF